ncbi:MAG: ParA family protein [Gemmatimonadota bacterium]|nr:ParA family protein [Gemmatimonadota bacterium]HEU4990016.1 ParA family protein [Gemmatimonadaceae bacterium]
MSRILAVVSQKGGVGKTTTAINIAAAFARRGVKTLLVDMDPQGSVRFGVGLQGSGAGPGIADYLTGARELTAIVRATALPFLRVLLAGTVADSGDHAAYQALVSSSTRLGELLSRARDRGYLVIVDTPPGLGPVVHRVLAAADRVVVPLQCEPLALQTTSQILKGIRTAVAEHPKLKLEGIILTMFEDQNALSRRIADYVRQQLPADLVFDVMIPRTPATVEAFAAGQPVVLRTPDDAAAAAYVALADVLQRRLAK